MEVGRMEGTHQPPFYPLIPKVIKPSEDPKKTLRNPLQMDVRHLVNTINVGDALHCRLQLT